jgi:hypothetical protein
MLRKSDLEALSESRLKEAEYLLNGQKYSGAYYLVGYTLELALKACIAKHFYPSVIPDKQFIIDTYRHDLGVLVKTAGLQADLDSELKSNRIFAGNWGVAKEWNVDARYEIWDVVRASSLFSAIAEPKNGALQWVKKHY